MNSIEALEQIYRDGVFIKENCVKGYVIDGKRTTEYFSEYCEIIKKDLDRLEKVEKDLHYLKEQNIELFQFQNGRIILGIDITNMPSEVERVKRIIKTTLKEVLGND